MTAQATTATETTTTPRKKGNRKVDEVAAATFGPPEGENLTPDAVALDAAAGAPIEEQPPAPEPGDDVPPGTAPVSELSPQTQNALQPAAAPPSRPTKAEKAAERVAQRELKAQQSPSTKKLGPIGAMLPGAEHIRIHKRGDNGQRGYVGQYGAQDLQRSQDIESFLAKYVQPGFGPGEYSVTGVTADGRTVDGGTVILLGPSIEPAAAQQQPQNNAVLEVLQEQMRRDDQRRQEEVERLRDSNSKTVQVDPVEQIGKLHKLSEDMKGDDSEQMGTVGAMITAMASSNQANMQMMVQMMAKSDERMTTLLTTMGAPKGIDPILGAILTKLLADKDSGGGTLPPPLPPPNPAGDLRQLAEVVALLRPPAEEGGGSTTKLIELLITRSEADRMSPTDVLNLVNQVKGERGTDDFKKTMENLGFMMNAVQTVRGQTEGGGGGFWDAVGGFFQNRELPGAVADAIRSKTGAGGQSQRPLVDPSGRPLQMGAGEVEQRAAGLQARREMLEQRRLELAERQLQMAEGQLNQEIQAGRGQIPPDPLDETRTPHTPRHRPQPSATEAAETAAAVERVRRSRPDGATPRLPPDIGDHVNPLLMAVDDAARIQALLSLFFYLEGHEDWQKIAHTMLHFLNEGDYEKSMKYVGSFLQGLQQINLIDGEGVSATLTALQANFNEVVEHVRVGIAADASAVDDPDADPDEVFEELVSEADALGLDGEGDDEGDGE